MSDQSPAEPTPTTNPDRRTTDDHGHDIVSPLQAAILTISTSRAEADGRGRRPRWRPHRITV